MARRATTFDVFNALAEPARRRIVESLSDGEMPVNDLVRRVRLAQPQVSKHLRVLHRVRVVRVRQVGRQRYYAVDAEALRPMHTWVSQFERLWDRQLTAIKTAAEAKARDAAR